MVLDNTNLEPIEKVEARAAQENRKYYFIVKDCARGGAVNVRQELSDTKEACL